MTNTRSIKGGCGCTFTVCDSGFISELPEKKYNAHMKGLMARILQKDPTVTPVDHYYLRQWLGIGSTDIYPGRETLLPAADANYISVGETTNSGDAESGPLRQVAGMNAENTSRGGRWLSNNPDQDTALNPQARLFGSSTRANEHEENTARGE